MVLVLVLLINCRPGVYLKVWYAVWYSFWYFPPYYKETKKETIRNSLLRAWFFFRKGLRGRVENSAHVLPKLCPQSSETLPTVFFEEIPAFSGCFSLAVAKILNADW